MATTFQRRILHHGPTPSGIPQLLSLEAIRSAWFELHRQGGCGAGEIQLADSFERRDRIEVGDWVSFETAPGSRWYLGRVEERRAELPARVRLRLEGMAIEFNEIFPGGFGEAADGRKPHHYAGTELFTHDPDRSWETRDSVTSSEEVVRLLLQQYVVGNCHIAYDPAKVESPLLPAPVESLKFRGEESVRSILKELAVRAQSASWGVDQTGTFFFQRPPTSVNWTYHEGQDLVSLAESRDREHLYNRLLLTGDYVYDRRDHSGVLARRSYRWRGNYFQPLSQSQYGERRIRLWLPWIRTQRDALAFAREFFRTYSRPTSRFFVETVPLTAPPLPWGGCVRLLDRDGHPLISARIETVRVLFDHALRVRMELGPDDPRNLWPEPPHDERWELPDHPPSGGGDVSLPPTLPSIDPPPDSTNDPPPTFSESWPDWPTSSGLTSSNTSALTSSHRTSEDHSSEWWESSASDSSQTESRVLTSLSVNSDSYSEDGKSSESTSSSWQGTSWPGSSFPDSTSAGSSNHSSHHSSDQNSSSDDHSSVFPSESSDGIDSTSGRSSGGSDDDSSQSDSSGSGSSDTSAEDTSETHSSGGDSEDSDAHSSLGESADTGDPSDGESDSPPTSGNSEWSGHSGSISTGYSSENWDSYPPSSTGFGTFGEW